MQYLSSGLSFQPTGKIVRRCPQTGVRLTPVQAKFPINTTSTFIRTIFPALGRMPSVLCLIESPEPFAVNGPRGACDVVLYSPEHTLPPSKLTVENWRKIIGLWTKRTAEHAANPDIALVDVFENSGDAVGVTMPHPHGQIYATPFLGPTVEKEVESTSKYSQTHNGACLFCDLLKEEIERKERIVASNEHFVTYVPFAARFPAETMICARRHVRTLLDLTEGELNALAEMISVIRKKYDNLYGFLLPLMMAVKQAPLQRKDLPYHFHVQFLPLQRSATKLKYLATMETGYGVFLADTAPEEMAEHLRNCEPKTV